MKKGSRLERFVTFPESYLFVLIISFFLFIPMYRSAVTGLLQTFLFHPRSCQRIWSPGADDHGYHHRLVHHDVA